MAPAKESGLVGVLVDRDFQDGISWERNKFAVILNKRNKPYIGGALLIKACLEALFLRAGFSISS